MRKKILTGIMSVAAALLMMLVFATALSEDVYADYAKDASNTTVGSHHLTKSKKEYDTLVKYGWKQEGIALYCEN